MPSCASSQTWTETFSRCNSSRSFSSPARTTARTSGIADFSLPSGATREGLVSPELSGGGAAAVEVESGSADAVLSVLGYFR